MIRRLRLLGLSILLASCASKAPPGGPPPEYEAVAPPAPSPELSTPEPQASTPTPSPAPTATASAAPAATASAAPTASASAAPAAPPALSVEGANLSIGSLTADGFTMKDLGCKVEGGGLGGLLLGPTIAAGLSKKKAALDACAPKGADVRVRFTAAGGRITAVEAAAGDPKIEACVVKALKGVPGITDGTCAATIHAGK